LTHLCEASGTQAELEGTAIPVHALADGRLELALHGGEDYELLFTASATARVPRTLAGVAVTEIGRMTRRRREQATIKLDGRPLIASGWEHFRS
jgi:thiamine-monophosphate kinase